MYRLLLVPLDGTDFAEHALPAALSLARRHGAALTIVHVYVPIAGVAGEHAVRYDEALDLELMARARAYLDDVIERLAQVAPIPVSSAMLEGPVAEAISLHAQTSGADLLVMTTHARSAILRFWLGGVADQLARQATVPILFVQAREETPDLAREPVFRRVLIPLDGSELAEKILEPALAFNAGTPAEYTLLRAVKQLTPLSHDPASTRVSGLRESLLRQLQELDHRERTQAQGYLEEVAGRLRARSLTVHTRVVSNERPAAAIIDDASENAADLIALATHGRRDEAPTYGADLIALATHGRGGLKRLLLGSVSDRVLRGAEKPILLYRPA